LSQHIAHHARMNKGQSVTQYVARHSKLRGRTDDARYVGRHALITGKAQRLGARRGGVLGRFLFLLLFLQGAMTTLTGAAGRVRGNRTGRYATPDPSACETTARLRPIYK